jgi:hypothetical protein
MFPISYRRHRFPPAVIQQAVWLYLRFTLSYRDVEELLAQRGLDLSYESVRFSIAARVKLRLMSSCSHPFALRLSGHTGPLLLFEVGLRPPHDGMRRMGRLNLSGALAAD